MRIQRRWWSGLVAAMLGGLAGVTAVAAAGEQFLPVLSTREGALRFQLIPMANGFIDYVTLLNERDGGINGVKLVWEECETVYDVDPRRGVLRAPERQGAHGSGGVSAVQHPAHLCPDGAGHARPDPPALRRALGARTLRMGGCFRISSTPRAATGVRTRPRSASSASGPAAWRTSRA